MEAVCFTQEGPIDGLWPSERQASPSTCNLLLRSRLYLQVAGVLRLWLSCLPEPLVPWDLARPVLVNAEHCARDQHIMQLQAMLKQVE